MSYEYYLFLLFVDFVGFSWIWFIMIDDGGGSLGYFFLLGLLLSV